MSAELAGGGGGGRGGEGVVVEAGKGKAIGIYIYIYSRTSSGFVCWSLGSNWWASEHFVGFICSKLAFFFFFLFCFLCRIPSVLNKKKRVKEGGETYIPGKPFSAGKPDRMLPLEVSASRRAWRYWTLRGWDHPLFFYWFFCSKNLLAIATRRGGLFVTFFFGASQWGMMKKRLGGAKRVIGFGKCIIP